MDTTLPSKIPPQLVSAIVSARARIRRILFLRGFSVVVATLLGAILCSMAVDAILAPVGSFIRWLMWFTAAVAVFFVARSALFKPLFRRISSADIAGLIEKKHPELEERLSTVVELCSTPGALSGESSDLFSVVSGNAAVDASGISPQREWTFGSIRSQFFAACVLVGVFGALFAIWPSGTGKLFIRAVAPSARVGNVYSGALKVLPGDAVVLEGTPLVVETAVLSDFPGIPKIISSDILGHSKTASERMVQTATESADGKVKDGIRHFRHVFGSVERSFRYKVSCGSASTGFYSVKVVPVPSFTNFCLSLEYPAYTRKSADLFRSEAGVSELSAVTGTKVSVSLLPNDRADASLVFLDRELDKTKDEKNGVFSWSWILGGDSSGSWKVFVWDEHGFSNAPVENVLTVVHDTPPSFSFLSPTNLLLRVAPRDVLPVAYCLEDDFGIGALSLEVCVGNEPWREVRSAGWVDTVMEGFWTGADEIHFSAFDLKGGETVRLRYAVSDNRPLEYGGQNIVRSPEIVITIDKTATSQFFQKLSTDKAAIEALLGKAEKSLSEMLETENEALQDSKSGNGSDEKDQSALEKNAQAMDKAVEAAKKFDEIAELAKKSAFPGLAEEIKAFSQNSLKAALDAIDQVAASDRKNRSSALQSAVEASKNALERAGSFGETLNEAFEKAKNNSGEKSENGGEKSENGGEKSDNGGEKRSENGGEKSENSAEKSENGGEKSDNGGEKSENGGEKSDNGGEKRDNGGEKSDNGGEKSDNGGEKSNNGGENSGNGSESNNDSSNNGISGNAKADAERILGSLGLGNIDENWFKAQRSGGIERAADETDAIPAGFEELVKDYFEALREK